MFEHARPRIFEAWEGNVCLRPHYEGKYTQNKKNAGVFAFFYVALAWHKTC